MTVSDQKLLDDLARIIPHLTHLQKEKLLSFGEGMACANNEHNYSFSEEDKEE